MPKAPAAPPRAPARFIRNEGIRISQYPNIERAMRTRTPAIPVSTSGFWRSEPKSLPESAAATPRAEYVAAMPRT